MTDRINAHEAFLDKCVMQKWSQKKNSFDIGM